MKREIDFRLRYFLGGNICISCLPFKAPKSDGQLSSFQGESLSQGSGFRWDAPPPPPTPELDSSWPPRQSFTLQCQASSSSCLPPHHQQTLGMISLSANPTHFILWDVCVQSCIHIYLMIGLRRKIIIFKAH